MKTDEAMEILEDISRRSLALRWSVHTGEARRVSFAVYVDRVRELLDRLVDIGAEAPPP
jgi:hypothetical protein